MVPDGHGSDMLTPIKTHVFRSKAQTPPTICQNCGSIMGPNHHFLNHDQTRNSLIRQMLFYHKSIAQCGGLRVSHEFHFERRKMPWVVHLAHMHFRSRFFEAAIVQVLRFESAPARPSQTNCSLTRLWGIFPVNEGKGI
jgi:hypothetical protein